MPCVYIALTKLSPITNRGWRTCISRQCKTKKKKRNQNKKTGEEEEEDEKERTTSHEATKIVQEGKISSKIADQVGIELLYHASFPSIG